MTMPGVVFGLVIATVYGAAFHAWRGGNAARLAADLLLSWVGFWLGQVLAALTGWQFGQVGTVYFGMATLGSAGLLALGYWLGKPQAAGG
jgi:hypothetical protein